MPNTEDYHENLIADLNSQIEDLKGKLNTAEGALVTAANPRQFRPEHVAAVIAKIGAPVQNVLINSPALRDARTGDVAEMFGLVMQQIQIGVSDISV